MGVVTSVLNLHDMRDLHDTCIGPTNFTPFTSYDKTIESETMAQFVEDG